MRKIKEVIRLKSCGLSERQISASLSIGKGTVWDYLKRLSAAGLSWPLPDGMDEAALERLLFPSSGSFRPLNHHLPDFAVIHGELKRKGVTLAILWEEYRQLHPDGYQYSRFCEIYRQWAGKLDLVMRQEHKAGERLFVDYAGLTVDIINRDTGEALSAQIFVAVMGASNYTYAEATWTQGLPDWIGSHVRAFKYLGAVPQISVPDNLRSGVSKACRYEPDINPTYAAMAAHYGIAVIPARVRKPKDKAKVEAGVLLVERWILARLRNMSFFSLAELNEAISELLERLNAKPFRKLPGSRKSQFESIDLPAMKPLPLSDYEYAEWTKARVNIDYHVDVDGHYYSVPYQLVKRQLDIRLTVSVVEIYNRGNRVASHIRDRRLGGHTTVRDHMPKSHQAYLEWTPQRIINWAATIGPNTSALVDSIMARKTHPELGYRSCLGIIRLAKEHTNERLESACKRAMQIGGISYQSVKSILAKGLDRVAVKTNERETLPLIEHEHIRGSRYYQ